MTEQTTNNATPERVLGITLTLDQVNTVLMGLADLPARLSMGLISEVQRQANRQLQPRPGDGNNGSRVVGGSAEVVEPAAAPPQAEKPVAAAAKAAVAKPKRVRRK